MKRFVFYAGALFASAMLLASCTSQMGTTGNSGPAVIVDFEPITFTSADTKAESEVVEFTVPTSYFNELIIVPGVYEESTQCTRQPLPSPGKDHYTFDGDVWALKDSLTYQAIALGQGSTRTFFSEEEMPSMRESYVASDPVKAENGVIRFTLKPRFSIIHLILDLDKPLPTVDEFGNELWWMASDFMLVDDRVQTANPLNLSPSADFWSYYKACFTADGNKSPIETFLAIDPIVNDINGRVFSIEMQGRHSWEGPTQCYRGSFTGFQMEVGKIYTIHVPMKYFK